MNDDLIHRLRTACSPESPLGKLCSEAAETLEGVTSDYLRRHNDAADRAEEIILLKLSLKRAIELLKPFVKISSDIPDDNFWPTDVFIAIRNAARFLQESNDDN